MKHYMRWRRHGDPEVVMPRGRPREPRETLAETLGRDLFPDEIVRHRNGDRSDMSLENLELRVLVQRHKGGRSVEDVLAWADEMIRRYR